MCIFELQSGLNFFATFVQIAAVKSNFVIFMSENLSVNLCCHLRRVNVSYQGEISLHFNLPSLYSCGTWSPLLRALEFPFTGYLATARLSKEADCTSIQHAWHKKAV